MILFFSSTKHLGKTGYSSEVVYDTVSSAPAKSNSFWLGGAFHTIANMRMNLEGRGDFRPIELLRTTIYIKEKKWIKFSQKIPVHKGRKV